MPTESAPQSPHNKNLLAYGEAWLNWKLKPRLGNKAAPNPADYNLTPEQGQIVIDECTRAIEQAAVEKATTQAKERVAP